MMHNMHPACESGAAIRHSHNVTPFLYHFCSAGMADNHYTEWYCAKQLIKADVFAQIVYRHYEERKRRSNLCPFTCHSEGVERPKNLGGVRGHQEILRYAQNDRK
jgi:hypothetical protein